MLANELSERQRDHKQVQNVAQAVSGETCQRKKYGTYIHKSFLYSAYKFNSHYALVNVMYLYICV